jgi:formylglycine-generating enzyme required for sulfatase activity
MKAWPAMAMILCGFAAVVLQPGHAFGAPAAAVTASCRASLVKVASAGTVLRDCQFTPQLIPLRGGTFRMGDQVGDGQAYELPVHTVSVAPFALGRFEVSAAEWKICVDAAACTESSAPGDEHHRSDPVAGISWQQAKDYTDWLSGLTGRSYRLPSEAEWEYAARAGETGRFPWPSGENACKRANMLDVSGRMEHPDWYWSENCNDQFSSSAPVGSFPPNAWGFHEMLGNVWEWVADCWHPDYTGAPSTSAAWLGDSCRKRVNRGGGWGNNLRSLRLSNRDADRATGYSDGLGFRIARDLSAAEVHQFANSAPDAAAPAEHIASVAPAPPKAAHEAAPEAASEAVPPPVLASAGERVFEIHLSIHGQQTWSKPPQHAVGVTDQEVVLGTRLRSDGVLYHDNLLDPDPAVRIEVKERYYMRQGLLRIKAMNGGKLPTSPEEIARLADQIEAGLTDCMANPQCAGEAVYRAAGLEALRNNPARDLETLVAAPASGVAARWLYYFGYSGCPGHIHITNRTHVMGERSIMLGGSRMVPWIVDRFADSQGSEEDRQQLCQRYVATADVRTGDVYVENLYIPSVPGVTVRSRGGNEKRADDNLSVPAEVLTWSGDKLRKTRETAELNDSLPANAPFDGDYTILGHFDGAIQVKLNWSFIPAENASNSSVPGS